jgi:hypothetical protein
MRVEEEAPQPNMEHSVPAVMEKIAGRLESLEFNLPKRIDAMAISPMSKLPVKVLLYRGALIWRLVELGRAASENFAADRLVAGIIVTRAVVETTAALWFLCSKVDTAVDSNDLGNIDEYLMRMNVGTATGSTAQDSVPTTGPLPRPIKVGLFLKHVEKDLKGFSHQYGMLSEYAHPNWAGTVLLYSKPNLETKVTDFGQNLRRADSTKQLGVINLLVALELFEGSYNRISDVMPAFIALCGRNLKDEAEGDQRAVG